MREDLYDLGIVIMPLVRIIKDAYMSWAQREEVAWAIQKTLKHHKQLMDEHSRFEGQSEVANTSEKV